MFRGLRNLAARRPGAQLYQECHRRATGRMAARCDRPGIQRDLQVDPGHPLIEDLKRKSFVAIAHISEAEVCAPNFLERFTVIARTGAGFTAFLAGAVGVAF